MHTFAVQQASVEGEDREEGRHNLPAIGGPLRPPFAGLKLLGAGRAIREQRPPRQGSRRLVRYSWVDHRPIP